MERKAPPVMRIQPVEGIGAINMGELWSYRELLYFLTWRDIKVRYKQTAIGIAWAALQPLAMMVVFTLFFGNMAKIPSNGLPYAVFALSGLLPWQLFSRTLSESTNSLVADQRLISKVFFPRLFVPTATSLAALVDFGIGLVFLTALMLYHGIMPSMSFIFFPLFILLVVMTALGVGYWLSALNVEFRDVMYTVPFLNQFWMFVTPIVYPVSLVPENWRILYGLNPMVAAVEGFRWCLLGGSSSLPWVFWLSACISVGVFLSGLIWFRKRERIFTDFLG